MVDYISSSVVELLRGDHQLALFFRMESSPALHLWLGVGDIPAKMGSTSDVDGTVYIGGGQLLNIPALEVAINGVADRVEFVLDGLTAENLANIEASAAETAGAEVHIGLTLLDQYYQPVTDIVPIWTGEAEVWGSKQATATGTAAPERSVVLTVGSGDLTRSRSKRLKWTNAEQQAIATGDLFCANVARIARGVSPVFPRY